mgnify:FL=1
MIINKIIRTPLLVVASILAIFVFTLDFTSATTIEQLDKNIGLACPINNYEGCNASQSYQDLGTGLSGKLKSITGNALVDTDAVSNFYIYLYDVTADKAYYGDYLGYITPFTQKNYTFNLNPQPVLDFTHQYRIMFSFGSWYGKGLKLFGSDDSNSYPKGEWHSDANIKDVYFILDFIEGQVLPTAPFSQSFTTNDINFIGAYDNAANFNKIRFFITDITSSSTLLKEYDIPTATAFDAPYDFNITLPKGDYTYYALLYNSSNGISSSPSEISNFQIVNPLSDTAAYQLYKDIGSTCPINNYEGCSAASGLTYQDLGAGLSGKVESITVNASIDTSTISNFFIYLYDIEAGRVYYGANSGEFTPFIQRDYNFKLFDQPILDATHHYQLHFSFGSWYGRGLRIFGSNNPDSYPNGAWHSNTPWGPLSDGIADIYFIINLEKPQNQPPTISNLNQYKSDGITLIPENSITTEDNVIFKATVSDPDNDQVKLQVEIKEFNQSFNEQNLIESSFVASGNEATITRYGFVPQLYKWRVRAVDSRGGVSDWQEFGTVGNIDFIVKTLEQAAVDLAKEVVNALYLGDGKTWGGKGWDSIQSVYVAQNEIFNGYNYWNNATSVKTIQFGAGLDCSGLVMWAYNRAFNPLKYYLQNAMRYESADGQYKNNSEVITENNLQAGDLLFMDKDNNGKADHVAMYVGEFVRDGEAFDIVEAFSPAVGIRSTTKTEYKTRPGFINLGLNGTRRVVLSPQLGGQVQAGSPIDLIVTDPEGFTITPTTAIQTDNEYLREIPGELYYTEGEIGSDGRPKDTIYWPKQKTGDYIIKAIPEEGVDSIATYSLKFTAENQTINLAENIPISQIPSEGYGVIAEESGTVNRFIPVLIDVKPDSSSNTINLGSNGFLPVAIFGSATFNVKQIDVATIKLANAGIKLKGNSQAIVNYEDINGDDSIDIIIHVITDALQLTATDVKANLEGQLIGGDIIKGSDSIRIVP